MSAWLGGQLLLAAIIGGTAALGLFLMGVPYFYVLALIAGIGEMIPIVGPLLAAVPAVAVAFYGIADDGARRGRVLLRRSSRLKTTSSFLK